MNKKGFTLVELLAIIVILGILASISTALVGDYVKKSKQDATRVTAQNMINSVLNSLEVNDEITKKTYDFLGADSNLLEKKLKTSAWDNDIVEAKVIYDNNKIGICIRDSKNNGIKGTADQVKEQSKDLQYKDIDCTNIPLGDGISSTPTESETQKTAVTGVASEVLSTLVGVTESGLQKVTHTIDNTLQVNTNFTTEYRYRGANVANYVTFNNETWRIIGIIPTDNGNGVIEKRLKLMKSTYYKSSDWVKSDDYTNIRYEESGTKTDATSYYNSLSANSKKLIGQSKFYLGGISNNLNITTSESWIRERKSQNGTDCTWTGGWSADKLYRELPKTDTCYYFKDSKNNLNDYIAPIYLSDYGYASASSCTATLNNYKTDTNCANNNYMLSILKNIIYTPGTTEVSASYIGNIWTITQSVYDVGIIVNSNGSISNNGSLIYGKSSSAFIPSLYLASNVKITSGDGTSKNPYQLSL